jgi:hypothetical protein
MSAHSAPHRGGWLSALVAQVSDWVFEEVEEAVEPAPVPLKPQLVTAVVAAAPRAGASTAARLLAAEMGSRSDGAAVVIASSPPRRTAPPSRAAIRLATALTGAATTHPVGRLCVIPGPAMDPGRGAAHPAGAVADRAAGAAADYASSRIDRIGAIVNAARYLAPVLVDLPADGSAAGIAGVADRIVVVGAASAEPALLDAVAAVIGGHSLKVANRIVDRGDWGDRADFLLSDSRLAARAAAVGTRALGSLGSTIAALADALEAPR